MVEAVRASLPADTDLVSYGPKTGVAVVLPEASAGAARELARDICAYDQQGCVSPRLVYVVGESTRPFRRRPWQSALAEHTRLPPASRSHSGGGRRDSVSPDGVRVRRIRRRSILGRGARRVAGVDHPVQREPSGPDRITSARGLGSPCAGHRDPGGCAAAAGGADPDAGLFVVPRDFRNSLRSRLV